MVYPYLLQAAWARLEEAGAGGCNTQSPLELLTINTTRAFSWLKAPTTHCLYLSAKYPVFNQSQKKSHRAQAHKLLDCSHIHQQHSTASTAQPARISSELSARRRWQSKESTGAMISEENYKLCDTSNRLCGTDHCSGNNNSITAAATTADSLWTSDHQQPPAVSN